MNLGVDLKAPLTRFDSLQQRHKQLAIPVAVVKKFGDDQGGNLAALIAYYAFFSLFPLLLVFVTILGYILHGDPSAQQSVASSVLGKFPIIGQTISGHQLQGHSFALVIGIITSMLAGMGVTSAAGQAFDTVWAVPMKSRPNFLQTRAQGLMVLVFLGVLFIVTTGASALVSGVVGGAALAVVGVAIALLLNCGLFMATFKLLGSIDVPWRALVPGVIVASILWEIVEVIGTVYINHFKHSAGAYGVFAVVIGVLAWLHLGAQVTVFSAEINVVLERKLWPRSFFGPPGTKADEEALTALAKVEERHDMEQVDVTFEPPAPPAAPAPPPSASKNSVSMCSRVVIESGHEQRPSWAGQPSQRLRTG
jgi:YihY family inner membrane protein